MNEDTHMRTLSFTQTKPVILDLYVYETGIAKERLIHRLSAVIAVYVFFVCMWLYETMPKCISVCVCVFIAWALRYSHCLYIDKLARH